MNKFEPNIRLDYNEDTGVVFLDALSKEYDYFSVWFSKESPPNIESFKKLFDTINK